MQASSTCATTPKLTPTEAHAFAEMALRASGVAISPTKLGFLEMRIGRRLREIGCVDFGSYLRILNSPDGETERSHLVEALTTHTTAFFRERAHFDWLASNGLPDLVAGGAGKVQPLTLWSAACSLGSEMWTSAMIADRFFAGQRGPMRWNVVGTDISRRVLRHAARAVFSESEIQDMPDDFRRDYLLRSKPAATADAGATHYRIVPELRQRARLGHANLLDLPARPAFTADVIFLRNVLIYFKPEDQRRAVANVLTRLRPGGILFTGHSESLAEIPNGLRQIGASIYQRT